MSYFQLFLICLGELWKNRFSESKKLLAECGDSWTRRKGIYYDEEGISEEQYETVHYCKDC